DQRREAAWGAPVARDRGREASGGRRGPVEARGQPGGGGEQVLLAPERGEEVARQAPDRGGEFGDPPGERRVRVPEQPVVVAFDRDREAVAEFAQLFARRPRGEQAGQAARVAGEGGA